MPKEFFTGDLISALADDESLFDVMHSSAENNSPVLGFMHDGLDVTLSRLDVPAQNLGAMQIGFKTFEILSSVDSMPPMTINEHALRVMTQGELTGNFAIDFIEQMDELEDSARQRVPEIVYAAEQLAQAHLMSAQESVGRYAVSGAALAWSVFDEVKFWQSFEVQMKTLD